MACKRAAEEKSSSKPPKKKVKAPPKVKPLSGAKTQLLQALEAHAESVHVEIIRRNRSQFSIPNTVPTWTVGNVLTFDNLPTSTYNMRANLAGIQKNKHNIVVSVGNRTYILDNQLQTLQTITYPNTAYSGTDGSGAVPFGKDSIVVLSSSYYIDFYTWENVRHFLQKGVSRSVLYMQAIGEEHLMFADSTALVFTKLTKSSTKNVAVVNVTSILPWFDFLPNGNVVFVTSNAIHLWDFPTNRTYKITRTEFQFFGPVIMLDYHRILVVADHEKHVLEVWNVRSGERELVYEVNDFLACAPVLVAYMTVAFVKDNGTVITIVNLETKQSVNTPSTTKEITSIALVNDNTLLAGTLDGVTMYVIPECFLTHKGDVIAQKMLKCLHREVLCDLDIFINK